MPIQLSMPGYVAQPGTPTRWLTTFLHVPESEIVGCTGLEIAELEKAAGRPLPLAYTQWMIEAGRRVATGRVASHFERSYLTYPNVLKIRDIALEVIRDSGADELLLDRMFPFYNWEVYRIGLLDLSQPSDDPPVFVLNESSGRERLDSRSFSQFIGWEIFELADALECQRRRRESKNELL